MSSTLPTPCDGHDRENEGDPTGREQAMTAADTEVVGHVVEGIEVALDQVVAGAVDAIWDQVPAYADCPAPGLRRDVTEHVDAIFRALLTSVRKGRPAERQDFPSTERQAGYRVRQAVSLADFLHAFRVSQLTLWEAVLRVAGENPVTREAALGLVGQVMGVIEVGSSLAAEAYLNAQQHELAESDRIRRDVLEDLLAGRDVSAGPKQAMLRAAGLEPGTRLIVVSATSLRSAVGGALAGPSTPQSSLDAVAAVRRITAQGFTVARQEEVVGVAPAPADAAAALTGALPHLLPELRRHGLAVGVSTAHAGLTEIPEAYAEACAARDGLGGRAGVIALPLLSSLDYLVLRHSETARRLIRAEVALFVREDLAHEGHLVATFLEYVACDLNARTAAQRLHMHPNTVYYRLERIAERTGCDLRRIPDVLELLVGVRLLDTRLADRLVTRSQPTL